MFSNETPGLKVDICSAKMSKYKILKVFMKKYVSGRENPSSQKGKDGRTDGSNHRRICDDFFGR